MIKEADQLVETIILPVAEQHGYLPVERKMGDDWWQFQRKSPKKPSFIISIIPPNRIRLSLRIQSLKSPMPGIDPVWWYHNTGNILPEICAFNSKADFERDLYWIRSSSWKNRRESCIRQSGSILCCTKIIKNTSKNSSGTMP